MSSSKQSYSLKKLAAVRPSGYSKPLTDC